MDADGQFQMVFCTCPTEAVAKSLATALVGDSLVACANIVPGLTSIYQWQGKVKTDQEVLLILKTHVSAFEAVKDLILDEHINELPEIIAVPITDGLEGYLDWIEDIVSP